MTEQQFQEQTADLLRALGWLAWHTPNESMSKARRLACARRGVLAGVPDWIIAEPWETEDGRSGSMIAIELKTAAGVVSSSQRAFMRQAEQRGWLAAVCRSMPEFTAVLRCVRSRNGRHVGGCTPTVVQNPEGSTGLLGATECLDRSCPTATVEGGSR